MYRFDLGHRLHGPDGSGPNFDTQENGMSDLRNIVETFYLALVVYREARSEPLGARTGVACTVLNRVARRGWWGDSIDTVICKKWQYSSMTDPKDVQLTKWPLLSDPTWIECLRVADEVLRGALGNPIPGADSYHDDSISPPAWTKGARFCGKLGRLNFYDVDHDYEAAAMIATAPADAPTDFDARLKAFLS